MISGCAENDQHILQNNQNMIISLPYLNQRQDKGRKTQKNSYNNRLLHSINIKGVENKMFKFDGSPPF